MKNTMAKGLGTSALLVAGGLTAGALGAGTMEFIATDAGKEIIFNTEDRNELDFGLNARTYVENFNDKIANYFIAEEELEEQKLAQKDSTDIEPPTEPVFKFENGKLVVNNEDFSDKAQPVLDNFYNIQDKKLIKFTENAIITLINDDNLDQDTKNNYIRLFLNAALGDGNVHYRADENCLAVHKTNFEEIREMAGNPANIDEDGTISDTKTIMEQVFAQATKVPLDELLKNKTFSANFQDAKNLKGKSVELTAQKTLSKDDKTMLAMEEFRQFKEYTSTVDIVDMRGFLYRYLDDISYMDPDKLTNDFVANEYLRIMAEQENLFQTTAQLNPGYKNTDVDVEDL